MEDWISQLPDEFLIHILSLLSMKEAAKTSVLSTRWRYLWTHTPCLNFDRMEIVKNIRLENEGVKSLMVERSKYITWVNTICSSIQAPSIKQFRIHFDLDETAKDNLDKWVEFAMEKKVKNLELILETLPWKSKRYILFCPTTVSSGFKHLQSLDLKFVNISGELLEHFLLHCPSLEQVSIQHSNHLTSLKVGVGGRLLNLNFLKIFYCSNLTDLQISAPKLSNFQYQGRAINLQIKNVPSLCHVYIIGRSGDCLTWAFSALSSHLCQLQTLTLLIKQIKGNTNFPQLWQLSSLRELTVRVAGCDYENLLYILSLLNASPSLEKFRLESALEQSGKLLEEKVVALCPLEYLKVLEIIGFDGRPNEVEFVRQLSIAAIRLEKLLIDPPIPQWEVFEPTYGPVLFPRKFLELLN